MRAMIVAAGLGTRLRPLTALAPKPALPVRGLPLIAYNLALLARHGVSEVMINTHHLPERLVAAAREQCPPGVVLHVSHEERLLDTGGAIRRVARFLRESDPCLIVGGDMLLDFDLAGLLARHRAGGRAVTVLLLRDPRVQRFGSLGIDAAGCVRRIPGRIDLGDEVAAGLYVWVNAVSARALDALPEREVFGHLDHWLAPLLPRREVAAELVTSETCTWVPVGTPEEYLDANLAPPALSYLDPDERAARRGVRFGDGVILGAGATIETGASLHRVVVWDGERVPASLRANDGVFAGGAFHSCGSAR